MENKTVYLLSAIRVDGKSQNFGVITDKEVADDWVNTYHPRYIFRFITKFELGKIIEWSHDEYNSR